LLINLNEISIDKPVLKIFSDEKLRKTCNGNEAFLLEKIKRLRTRISSKSRDTKEGFLAGRNQARKSPFKYFEF
jgi:hypothetical protein